MVPQNIHLIKKDEPPDKNKPLNGSTPVVRTGLIRKLLQGTKFAYKATVWRVTFSSLTALQKWHYYFVSRNEQKISLYKNASRENQGKAKSLMKVDLFKYQTTKSVAVFALLLTGCLTWPGEAGSEDRISSTNTFSIHDETLDAHLVNIPLGQVLSKIQDMTHIQVFIDPQVAKSLVTKNMINFPLKKGIRHLLKGHRYTLTFSENRESHPENLEGLVAIHVFAPSPAVTGVTQEPSPLRSPQLSKEAGNSPFLVSPSSSEGHQSTGNFFKNHPLFHENFQNLEEDKLKELALNSQDLSEKLAALGELADRQQSQEFLPVLASSLKDSDPRVREFTLELLENLETVPWDLITEVALNDPSPHLRVEALDNLAQTGGQFFPVAAIGKITINDQEPSIRLAALELLSDYVFFDNPEPGTLTTVENFLGQSLVDPLPEIREEAQNLLENFREKPSGLSILKEKRQSPTTKSSFLH